MVRIDKTEQYDKWFSAIRDRRTIARIRMRLARIEAGNFGDCKSVGDGVYEMRFHYGAGLRIYYAHTGEAVVLLLAGGDKSTQSKDILQAKALYQRIKEQL